MTKIAVILGSTRPGCHGEAAAGLVDEQACARSADTEVVPQS